MITDMIIFMIIKNMKKQLSLIAIPVAVVMLLSSFSPVPAALSKGENNGSGNPDFEMLEGNLPALNQNDLEDNGLGKHLTADDAQKAANNGEVKNPVAPMGADAQMMELMAMIQALQMEIKAMRAELVKALIHNRQATISYGLRKQRISSLAIHENLMVAVGEIENKMLSQFQSRVHSHLQ